MTEQELIHRAEDLMGRAESRGMVTHTGFLTPAEQYTLNNTRHLAGQFTLSGGGPDCERQAAFFLPEYLTAFHVLCRFAAPGHRDILGSLLGLGIERWSVGDIHTDGEHAWFYCLPSVAGHIAGSLDKVGRGGAKTEEIPLAQVPAPERRRESLGFTVPSLRLDAVVAGTFNLSRGQAADKIAAGLVQLNYAACEKPAAPVEPGDVFSLRGGGKASLVAIGGKTRKDRISIQVEKFL